MKTLLHMVAVLALLVVAGGAAALSVPADKLDEQKVYWGNPDDFAAPCEVNYRKVVMSTPEYDELKRDKIEKGTAKYWILLTQASERAIRVIADIAEKEGFDLVVDAGILGALEPPIVATNMTETVVEHIED